MVFKMDWYLFAMKCKVKGKRIPLPLYFSLRKETLQRSVCELQVKDLEEQLENTALHKEIRSLKQQLGLLEEDKRELELKYQNSEEKARDLKHSGKSVRGAVVSD